MAFLEELTINPLNWSILLLIGIFSTILTGTVARLEYQKRQLDTIWSANRQLRITSAVSITCGLLAAVQLCLDVIPGFCMMQCTANGIMNAIQFTFMGLYQLSILHYSFGKHDALRPNGYPRWVFLMMIAMGIIILLLYCIIITLGHPLPTSCGFEDDLFSEFKWKYRKSSILFEGDLDEQYGQFFRWHSIIVFMGSIWDITTLLLYCYKIKIFRETAAFRHDAVWRNIIPVLERIVVITLFYQISFLVLPIAIRSILIHVNDIELTVSIHNATIGLLTVTYSISMYLMMEHNRDEYLRFLRCLKRSYLKYLCFCCCHRIVDRQLEDYEEMNLEKEAETLPNLSLTSTWFPNSSKNVVYRSNLSMNMSHSTETDEFEDDEGQPITLV